jgi:predicted  nucleic acid-binding Zn-ribbon protein
LEKSLPFAKPLQEIEKRLDILRQEKKTVGEVMNEIYTRLKKLDEEIEEYKGDLDNLFKNKEETQKNLDPVVQTKKEEFKD